MREDEKERRGEVRADSSLTGRGNGRMESVVGGGGINSSRQWKRYDSEKRWTTAGY